MIIESVSGVKESNFSIEVIWEASAAVVTFNGPAGQENNTQPHWDTQRNMFLEMMFDVGQMCRSLSPARGSSLRD